MFCDARQGSARKPEVIMGWLGLPCLPACVPDSFGKTFAFPFLGNNLTHHLKLEKKKKCDPRPAMRARSESRNDYELPAWMDDVLWTWTNQRRTLPKLSRVNIEQFLMVAQGKERKPEVVMGSPLLVYLRHIQNAADTEMQKHESFSTQFCFPSISRNLGLAASHSSLGEMTSLIERPTTSGKTSVTSAETHGTST